MHQISQFKWIAKKDANVTVAAAMKPSVRFTLDECHDIPATTYSMRHVDPTSEQKMLYQALIDQLHLEYKGNEITAVNEGAKLSKLLQISAGFAYSDDKGVYINAKSRMKEVINLIEQADKKVLIFANFKWIIRALAEVVSNYYSVAVIHGDVSKGERDKIFAGFRRSNDPHVIIAHAGTMAHGLTLVEADTIIWYGPTLNSELYEQANARIRRPGQSSHTHVIHIESTPAEKKMFRRLQTKQKSQGLLLELFSETDYES
jgi:SNF2 family DNA or RNA helicase